MVYDDLDFVLVSSPFWQITDVYSRFGKDVGLTCKQPVAIESVYKQQDDRHMNRTHTMTADASVF